MNANVIAAILRRNLVSYFSNPTGYVFICVFVLLSSFAAFWPNEFFNENLANLNQLTKSLPLILLVFIPAITMSIWAEERRQGTDELLLTIPATDFDVVLGKYLAAVGIYTVSLAFSAMCSFCVLGVLSTAPGHFMNFDFGLFFATYFGYWMVGLAMLAIGMAASFLTGNLTVGFVLGAVFNMPLVFAASADSIALPGWVVKAFPNAQYFVKHLSLSEQLRDYGRGVITFSSIVYFLSLVAVMLYLSMVFIGRRHWSGGRDGESMGWHYLARVVSLLLVALGLNLFLTHHNRARFDVSSEGLSSVSPETRKLIDGLDPKRPVTVEAYLSVPRDVPEGYIVTRLNLLGMLRELQSIGGDKLEVKIHEDMEPFTEEATRAEQQYGITPRQVFSRLPRGANNEGIFMGIAVTCGLEKVVAPFIDRGIPVEYELVRSICTASQQKRKKIGVLTTDARLFGGFDPSSMRPTPNQLIIDELQKQYDVTQVDASSPITERFDVLLAVQPSSLSPPQMDNFVAAVAAGQPTAVFEDPLPVMSDTPGTMAPKLAPGGMMGMFGGGRQPQPKGDITRLWKLLGVDFMANDVVWENWNPYPKSAQFITREWVFVDPENGEQDAFNERNPIAKGLRQVLLVFPGSFTALNNTKMTVTPLMRTNKDTGVLPVDKVIERNPMGQGGLNPRRERFYKETRESYLMGAYIHGPIGADNPQMSDKPAEDKPADDKAAAAPLPTVAPKDASPGDKAPSAEASKDAKGESKPAEPEKAPEPERPKEISVVLVPDIDCLFSGFFAVRARGSAEEEDDIDWRLQNVTFVLNTLDTLAGDDRFIGIRKREPVHKTLVGVSAATQDARQQAETARTTKEAEFEKEMRVEQEKFDKVVAEAKKKGLNDPDALTNLLIGQKDAERRLRVHQERIKQELDHELKKIEHERMLEVRAKQDEYKMWAVVLPPIPPLLLAFFVFFNRRAQEREGVSKARLR